jgi:hypothetical protein
MSPTGGYKTAGYTFPVSINEGFTVITCTHNGMTVLFHIYTRNNIKLYFMIPNTHSHKLLT